MNNLLLIACAVLVALPVWGGEPVVIVNKSVSVTSLDKATIEKIYLGKKSTWDDGTAIVAVTLKDGEVHETFLKSFVGKSVAQFTAFWNQLVFTGKGIPPRSFSADTDIVKFVSETKGAIGYVSSGTSLSGAKSLTVQ